MGNRAKEDIYDPSNNLKHMLLRTYDLLNRLSITTDALSHATLTSYDSQNRVANTTDANNIITHQDYDGLNRLKDSIQNYVSGGLQTGTQNIKTQYAYDVNDNLVNVVDPDNIATSYTYDGLNNLRTVASHDTGNTTYTYDVAGNRKTQTDARNVTATYGYDALNRITSISYPTTSLNVTFTYDQAASGCFNVGHLVSIADSSGQTTYCYDRRGNVLSKIQLTNGVSMTTRYAYTSADRSRSVTYPSGAVVTYGRDAVGRINSVSYKPSGGTATMLVSNVTYYPFGPLNVITFGNGRTLTKTYDQNYAIDKVVSSAVSGLVIDATVDALGNVINASNTIGATPSTRSYQYDPLYRLTGATDVSNNSLEAYTYDATGDRLSKTPQGQSTQSYTYTPATHQLTSVAGVARTYDPGGNTIGINKSFRALGKTFGFTYDDRNRLSIIGQQISGCLSCSQTTINQDYNGHDERVVKTTTVTIIQNNSTTTTTTRYVYNEAGQLLGDYTVSSASGTSQNEYIYLDGAPIGVITNGQLDYIETDQLGTPRQVIQPGATTASDTTVWQWDYFASNSTFGENAPSVQTITFNLRFPGQYYDSETGLNYNYARDYDPATGRYVESDPIGLHGDISTYAYVMDSPLNSDDALGLATRQCSKGGRKNLGTEGFNKNSSAADVAKALAEAIKNNQRARIAALRALLKVIKRGGSMMFIIDPANIFRYQCAEGDIYACISYCKLSPEDEACKQLQECTQCNPDA